MPKLQCKVKQCVHNTEGLCSKNYIDVDGVESNTKKETSCKSYLFNNLDNLNYEFSKLEEEKPSLQTEVYCDAVKCVYEKGQKCYADRIEIANVNNSETSNSKEQSITHCKTFEPRD